jgi:hypothetical protein
MYRLILYCIPFFSSLLLTAMDTENLTAQMHEVCKRESYDSWKNFIPKSYSKFEIPECLSAYCKYSDLNNLLAKGADCNAFSDKGYTPLMASIIQNDEEAMKILLNCRTHILIKNKQGENALSLARSQGNKEMARLLIKYLYLRALPLPKELIATIQSFL